MENKSGSRSFIATSNWGQL